jgi:DnaJ like chaperone protein
LTFSVPWGLAVEPSQRNGFWGGMKLSSVARMTVWQKISGLATAVGDAGGGLLGDLAHMLGMSGSAAEPHKDVAFTIGVIALAAKMARSDGVVVPIEERTFERVFTFAPDQAENVKRVFELTKQDVAGFEAYADQIAGLLKDDRKLLQHVLEGLMHVAAADGILHPKENKYLAAVATRFGFSDTEFRHFRARFVTDPDSPYDVLRLSPDCTDDELKARYRTLVKDNHPDRVMARGVPAEFVDLATRKLAAINAAYEAIARERGL